jgi:hypothetical protein
VSSPFATATGYAERVARNLSRKAMASGQCGFIEDAFAVVDPDPAGEVGSSSQSGR